MARPERHELALEFTTLAVRYGTRYCAVDEPDCYGWFEQPCDFTDFRYGPTLAPFFPTCKADEAGRCRDTAWRGKLAAVLGGELKRAWLDGVGIIGSLLA